MSAVTAPGDFEWSLAMVEAGGSLSTDIAQRAMDCVVRGQVPNPMLARWLGAMSLRVPTSAELLGFVKAFLPGMVRVPTVTPPERILDTCGTGGAPKVFNASTLSALVAASGGAPCAKHGNRSRTGFGSSETLAAMGLRIDADPVQQARSLDETGFCFCLAPRHHPSAAHAAEVRRAMGVPTIFNVIGPLVNPAGALRQVIGVWDERLLMPVAETLAAMGAARAIVLHAMDGLDEVSVCAPTRFVQVDRGSVIEDGSLEPGMLGLPMHDRPPQRATTLAEAVSIATALLEGRDTGARRDMLLANAAVALVVSGHHLSWNDAAGMARDLIDGRRTLQLVERLAATA